jgi:PAS domain S-box-containing protein
MQKPVDIILTIVELSKGCWAMRLNLTLFQKALVLIAVPLAFQLVFVFILGALRRQVEQEKMQQVHAREIYRHLDRMLRNVMDHSMESIVSSVSKSVGFEDKEAENRQAMLTKSIHDETAEVSKFVAGNEDERKAFAECDDLQQQLSASWDQTKSLMDSGNRLGALRAFRNTQILAQQMLKQCDRLSAAEHSVESTQLEAEVKHRDQIELLIKSAVLLNILLAVALAVFFNIGTARRLNILMDNIVRLGADVSLNPPLLGDDEIARLDQTFHNMAEALALAARQERAIIDKTTDVICSLNPAGKFTRVSPAASQAWGYNPADLLGRNHLDLIAAADKERAMSAMDDIKAGLREEPIETRVIRRDGRVVDTMWSARWSQEDQTIFCVAHDITARKQLEQMRQEFITMVSHDLRSPLTSVQTFLDLLETGICGDLNDKGKQKLRSVNQNVERLIDLIRDLLDLERFKSGIPIIDATDVSLSSVIDRSVEAIKLQSEHLGIEIKVEAPDVQIHADAERLIQAIVNLLSNSLKFSPKGSTILISGKTDNDWVELRVTDQGRGISVKDQARIFERFQQVKEEDADFKRGTGLGLPICKAIIEQHGGEIGVESEKGKGSCFWLRLPLRH